MRYMHRDILHVCTLAVYLYVWVGVNDMLSICVGGCEWLAVYLCGWVGVNEWMTCCLSVCVGVNDLLCICVGRCEWLAVYLCGWVGVNDLLCICVGGCVIYIVACIYCKVLRMFTLTTQVVILASHKGSLQSSELYPTMLGGGGSLYPSISWLRSVYCIIN